MGYKWSFADPLPGGHTLYTRAGDGDIAIGDRSGATPELTDDGVLWLDLSGERTPMYDESGRAISIPVIRDRDKEPFSTVVNLIDFLLIAHYWDSKINVRGVLFTFMRSDRFEKIKGERDEFAAELGYEGINDTNN